MGKSFSHPCEISQPRALYRRKCGNWFRPFEVHRDTPPGHHKMDSHGTKIWSPTSLTNSLHTKSHKMAHTHITQNHPDSIQHDQHGWNLVGSGANCRSRAVIGATTKNSSVRFGDRPRSVSNPKRKARPSHKIDRAWPGSPVLLTFPC